MNSKNNNEIYRNATALQINLKEKDIDQMLSWLHEWKDSKRVRNLLLGQINKARLELKLLCARLKVIDFINKFRTQPKKVN